MGDVEVCVDVRPDEIILVFEDDGIAFDPRTRPQRTEPTSIDDAPVGGLGLLLVNKVAARMDYARHRTTTTG